MSINECVFLFSCILNLGNVVGHHLIPIPLACKNKKYYTSCVFEWSCSVLPKRNNNIVNWPNHDVSQPSTSATPITNLYQSSQKKFWNEYASN